MDHKTAVLVILNAMQSDKLPEDIQKEVNELLQTVAAEDREAVLKEATETYKKVQARLPVDPSSS
jgi:uncharacterized membrane protein